MSSHALFAREARTFNLRRTRKSESLRRDSSKPESGRARFILFARLAASTTEFTLCANRAPRTVDWGQDRLRVPLTVARANVAGARNIAHNLTVSFDQQARHITSHLGELECCPDNDVNHPDRQSIGRR